MINIKLFYKQNTAYIVLMTLILLPFIISFFNEIFWWNIKRGYCIFLTISVVFIMYIFSQKYKGLEKDKSKHDRKKIRNWKALFYLSILLLFLGSWDLDINRPKQLIPIFIAAFLIFLSTRILVKLKHNKD